MGGARAGQTRELREVEHREHLHCKCQCKTAEMDLVHDRLGCCESLAVHTLHFSDDIILSRLSSR
jgi:hypothetical protein